MIDLRLTLLALGCVVFGGLIVAELYADPGEPFAIAAVAPRREEPPVAPLTQPARLDDLLAATLARPLFSQTRRPMANAPEAAAGPDLSGNRLAGIVTAPDRRLAIFDVTGAKPLVVAEGDTVSGWQVESITPTEVALVSSSGTRTLQPTLDSNPPPAHPQARANAAPQPAAPAARPPGPPFRPVVPQPNAAAQPQPARPTVQANQAPAAPAPPLPRSRLIAPGPQR